MMTTMVVMIDSYDNDNDGDGVGLTLTQEESMRA